MTPLPRTFFLHPPDHVARSLLGKLVLSHHEGELLAGRIVETEAYFGADDPAAHSFAGRTARTEVLFGPPGHAYVYFIYGMHYCLNVVCEPEGDAGCVLLRALEPLSGLAEMLVRRKLPPTASTRLIASGPGKLCQAFGVTREGDNGADLTSPLSSLRIVDAPGVLPAVRVTPRIGIRKATERPLRFVVADNKFVSSPWTALSNTERT